MKATKPIAHQTLFYVLILIFGFINIRIGYCDEYRAELTTDTTSISRLSFEKITIPILLHNKSSKIISSDITDNPVFISYHLLGNDGTLIKYDNIRTSLGRALAPNEMILASVRIEALPPGKYIAQVDLVAEGKTWFEQQGTIPLNITIQITNISESISSPQYEFETFHNDLTWYVDNEDCINVCSMLFAYTLKENYVSFQFMGYPVFGFSAGSIYPAIWTRDSATIMPSATYIFNDRDLKSWILAHLSVQKDDGELFDWIKSDQTMSKNTAESDQESSMVIAAYELSRSNGYGWIKQKVNSRPILDRLDNALEFLFSKKVDIYTGLIKSGNTADWGDVTNEFDDQRATNLYDKSHEVAGIYTNSSAYGAAVKLADMFACVGQGNKCDYWRQKARTLLQNIQKTLWQQDKGFFKVHRHINFAEDDFDESNIFPMGGNAVAIEMGVATAAQAQAIIETALYRQKLFNVSTVSGALLPCYPKGYFRHPILKDYFEYQNGGEWDWFGNRLILQMFVHEHPQSFNKLVEVCNQVYKNRGFFEWNTIDGIAQGSAHYSGSAATLATSVIEGLFGIRWDDGKILVRPRLKSHSGYVYVPKVTKNEFVSYRYEFKPVGPSNSTSVKITFGSNSRSSKTLILPRFLENMEFCRIDVDGKGDVSRHASADSSTIELNLGNQKSEILVEYR